MNVTEAHGPELVRALSSIRQSIQFHRYRHPRECERFRRYNNRCYESESSC